MIRFLVVFCLSLSANGAATADPMPPDVRNAAYCAGVLAARAKAAGSVPFMDATTRYVLGRQAEVESDPYWRLIERRGWGSTNPARLATVLDATRAGAESLASCQSDQVACAMTCPAGESACVTACLRAPASCIAPGRC